MATGQRSRLVLTMNNRPSRADGEATRDRVMWTALKLFSERGIDAVSTRDIVAAAGERVNAAAIHYHFGSKGNLVRELIRSCFEAMAALESQSFERLEREAEPTPRQVVTALVSPMQQLAADKRGRQMVGFLLETWRHPDYMDLHQSYEEPMERRRLAAIQRSVPGLALEKQIVWAIVVSGIAARFVANREIDSLARALAPPGVEIDVDQAVID
ncbi:MAG TPA: helix-turn-helix domain-containing protein, partial [Acidimicrobiales bacterium]|nr:helix-turn-helix domain-containing protein [Acidimicrobiales bacterium]